MEQETHLSQVGLAYDFSRILRPSLQRDAADAANDAEKLADLLDRRFYATIAHAHGRNQAYGE